MQIKCTFCGASVDTSKHSECPHCGAQIGDNKQYQQYQQDKQSFDSEMRQLELEEKQEKVERQRLENERMRTISQHQKMATGASKFVKAVAIFIGLMAALPIILVILAVIAGLFLGITGKDLDFVEETEPYVEPYHEAVAGEVVSTRDYQVVLDKWGYYEPQSYEIHDGEKYIKFHFTYTNISDREMYDGERVYCYDVTGKICDSPSINDDDRAEKMNSQLVRPGKSYSGWLYYSLPEDATEAIIMYGESIEIKVNLDENNELFDKDTATIFYEGNFNETLQTKKTEIIFDDFGYYVPEMTFGDGNQYIKLHVIYKNIGSKDISVASRIPCYDENGAEYNSVWMWLTDEDGAQKINDQKIAPGKSYSGWYYFEIPKSVNELTIMPFTNVEIHINLLEAANETH